MDRLSAADVATCRGHVNSYPLESLGGKSPLDAMGGLLPAEVLSLFSVTRLEPGEVVMLPRLM